MAAPDYLFVNKTYESPSLSRNTGFEAALASKVNKHVQNHRFKSSKHERTASRQSQYRAFDKSGSSTSTSPAASVSSPPENDDQQPVRSSNEIVSTSKRLRVPSRRTSRATQRTPGSLSNEATRTAITNRDRLSPDRCTTQSWMPTSIDVIEYHITPVVQRIVDRYMQWAINASVTATTIKEGTRWVFQHILTNQMHRMAFLAAATAHQKKTENRIEPGCDMEYYRYEATRLINQHIAQAEHKGKFDRYVLVDIFRLAMSEWLSGQFEAARIHMGFLALQHVNHKPKDHLDQHHMELMSTADIFIALDLDEPPLMALNWTPALPTGPYPPTPSESDSPSKNVVHGIRLLEILSSGDRDFHNLFQHCLNELAPFSDFTRIDFATPVDGPIWVMKRRLHAVIWRLQSITTTSCPIENCIRRTLIILLFLATTPFVRRHGRTDVAQVARKLELAICSLNPEQDTYDDNRPDSTSDTPMGLMLWTNLTGLAAATEEPRDENLRQRFLTRSVRAYREIYEDVVDSTEIYRLLAEYMTFDTVHCSVVDQLIARLRHEQLTGLSIHK